MRFSWFWNLHNFGSEKYDKILIRQRFLNVFCRYDVEKIKVD